MHQNKKNLKANTLLELLLYLALSSIVIAVITGLYTLIVRARVENDTMIEVQSQAQIVTNIINREISNAQGINSPLIAASGTSLSLINSTASLDPTVFSLVSGQLTMTQGLNPSVPLTSEDMEITSLSFENNSIAGTPGIITYEFTIDNADSIDLPEKSFERTYRTSVNLK